MEFYRGTRAIAQVQEENAVDYWGDCRSVL
jgi:hypothetical protein